MYEKQSDISDRLCVDGREDKGENNDDGDYRENVDSNPHRMVVWLRAKKGRINREAGRKKCFWWEGGERLRQNFEEVG